MLRKILPILLMLCLIATPSMAADYFMDPECAEAGGDGTTQQCDGDADDVFKTLAAFDAVASAGDVLWVRRTKTQTFAADYAPAADGTVSSFIYIIGWPRDAIPNTTITQATWTNGSTEVDAIVGITPDREKHQGRWATGPDGFDYLITDAPGLVGGADSVTIDRPYAGATVSTTNGKFAIKADTLPNGVTQPADAENWDGDADDLPLLDFSGGAYGIASGANNTAFYYLDFKGGTDEIYLHQWGTYVSFFGCLFLMPENDEVIFLSSTDAFFDRCIIEGDSDGASQRAFWLEYGSALYLENSAIYNMGDLGIYVNGSSKVYLENVNIGREALNDDEDIYINSNGFVSGRDVFLEGTNGEVYIAQMGAVTIANHDKVLGAWKNFFLGGIAEKVAVTGVTPNKKLSDDVIEITPQTAATFDFDELEMMPKVWESRKTYDAGTYNIKVWIYNDTGNTLNDTTFSDDILMRCRAEAGNYGDATTEYVSMPWTYSDEIDILDAADADDWDYLQCDSVVVDQSDTKIYCEILVSTYDAGADPIFIDPQSANP